MSLRIQTHRGIYFFKLPVGPDRDSLSQKAIDIIENADYRPDCEDPYLLWQAIETNIGYADTERMGDIFAEPATTKRTAYTSTGEMLKRFHFLNNRLAVKEPLSDYYCALALLNTIRGFEPRTDFNIMLPACRLEQLRWWLGGFLGAVVTRHCSSR